MAHLAALLENGKNLLVEADRGLRGGEGGAEGQ